MNETYETELQMEINFLRGKLAYLQTELETAHRRGDADEIYPLCAGMLARAEAIPKTLRGTEKREQESGADPLTAFNSPA